MTPCIRLYGKYVFPHPCGDSSWRSVVRFRLFAPELFSESHCGTICAGNFIRGKACCGACHDFFAGTRHQYQFVWHGGVGFCGIASCHEFCTSHFVSRFADVSACSVRYHDRIHLFRNYRFCVTFADDSNIVNLHNWSMGSFSGMTWDNIRMMAVLVGITIVITFLLAKPIGAYQLGESYARNMGVNVKALRVALILLSSLLSACVTAFAGPISFVGIAVPHLVRMATKTAKPLILIPGCFLAGAVITLFCDGIARTVFAPTEISISSVTAVFLVPVVIVAMLRKQNR